MKNKLWKVLTETTRREGMLDSSVLDRASELVLWGQPIEGADLLRGRCAEFVQRAAEETQKLLIKSTSGGTEMEATDMLWERSVESHCFRYTTMLSGGDSRTHKHLSDLCVYGSDIEIEKEECINHVAKRMGTALRKLASEGKKSGTSLGGRGYGKLKQATIIKLTGYHGKAIRSHPGDLDAMRNAVFAIFFHAESTDEDPHHSRYPVGSNSWCFYSSERWQRDRSQVPIMVLIGASMSVYLIISFFIQYYCNCMLYADKIKLL